MYLSQKVEHFPARAGAKATWIRPWRGDQWSINGPLTTWGTRNPGGWQNFKEVILTAGGGPKNWAKFIGQIVHSLKKETPRLFKLNFKKSGSNFFWAV